MVYSENGTLIIRAMRPEDADEFHAAFAAQGWDKPRGLFEGYYAGQQAGVLHAFVAQLDGQAAGYVTLLPGARSGPFQGKGIPELCDFNVLARFQRQGIGTALLDAAEAAAQHTAGGISLGVGLYAGYGAAQRMYVKRGYVPDGSGIWHGASPVPPYESCRNDDDLVLYLFKALSAHNTSADGPQNPLPVSVL